MVVVTSRKDESKRMQGYDVASIDVWLLRACGCG